MGVRFTLLALFLALLVSVFSTFSVFMLPYPVLEDPFAPRVLASGGMILDPVFSPDGRFVAYSSNASGGFDIWLIDVNGRNKVRLTSLDGDERKPQFSPDGKRVAFIYSSNEGEDIWVVNRDGSNLLKITDSRTPKNRFEWSPKGNLIVYDTFANDKWSIWLTSLNKETSIIVRDFEERYEPSWSRDGRFVVCVNRSIKGYSLELIDVSTNYIKKIYTTSAFIMHPRFFSSDRKIIFLQENDEWSIYTLRITDLHLSNLLADPLRYYAGIPWTPSLDLDLQVTRSEASELLFVGYSKQGAELFILYDDIELDFRERGPDAVKGSIIERVFTIGSVRINGLSWSQDGHNILLSIDEGDYSMLSLIVLEKKKVSPYEK